MTRDLLFCALLALGFSACGSPEQKKPTPTKKTIATTKPPTPWSKCEPAVEVTAGVVVQCLNRTVILSQWTESTTTEVLGQIQKQLTSTAIKASTHMLRHGQQSHRGLHYAQKSPKRQGVIIALSRRDGMVRTVNCMVARAMDLKQCEVDLLELAQSGHLPAQLEVKTKSKDEELVPRIAGKAMIVPTSCRWYKKKILCTDGSFLLWRELADGEGERFEKQFIAQLRQGVQARSTKMMANDGLCVGLGQQVACQHIVSESQAHGRQNIVVAPVSHRGAKAIVICSTPGQKPIVAKVCKQAISWQKTLPSKRP